MIAWTVGTTSPITRSYSSSFTVFNTSTLFAVNTNGVLTLTFQSSTSYSASGSYSETQAGATSSYVSSSQYSAQTGNSSTQKDDSTFNQTGTFTSSASSSASGTGGNTNFPAAPSQTTTTETYSVFYDATITSTADTTLSGYALISSYTTYTDTDVDPYYTTTLITGTKRTLTTTYDPSVEEPESYPTITLITTDYSTFEGTRDATFYPTQTTTTSNAGTTTTTTDYFYVTYDLIATIYQANTRDENAEVLYKLSANSAYSISPATSGASTGTRFTVAPSVITSQIATIFSYTALTGANSTKSTTQSFSGSTQSLSFTTTNTTSRTLTAVSSYLIPHSTSTYTSQKTQTISSSSTWLIWSPFTITYGYPSGFRATISTQYNTHKTSGETKSIFFGDISYHSTLQKRFTTTFSGTTLAYNTSFSSSFLTSENRASTDLQAYLSYTDSSAVGTTEIGNTLILENPRITTESSPQTSVQSFITKGFVIRTGTAPSQTTAGGWITANGSKTFETFSGLQDSWYALEGSNISGTTIFPRTNASYTWSINSQTFTITSASGTDTITTTASHAVGASGSTITTIDAGRVLGALTRLVETVTNPAGYGFNYWTNQRSAEFYHFGCLSVISGQSIVNRGGEGVYRNLINSSSVSLDGNDTIYSGASTAPISFLMPIKSIGQLTQGFSKNDIVWAEPRNSTQLPFYRLPQ